MTELSPRAFISHSSADKDRFVLPFAERLRANGIDAWLDKWEMLPGDSLVDRIFEGGIGQSSAFIIVLSKASLASRWVRDELDAGVVNRIEGRTRLIPVLIEDVEVPQALKATLYERVDDLTSIDGVVDRVARSIFGVVSPPPIGPRPPYATQVEVEGLTSADSTVLGVLCRQAIDQHFQLVHGGPAFAECAALGLTVEAVEESLDILASGYYINNIRRGHTAAAFHCSVTWYGLLAYLEATRPGLGASQQAALATVLNSSSRDVERREIAEAIGVEPLVVEALLSPFEDRGLSSRAYLGGDVLFRVTSPALRRQLR